MKRFQLLIIAILIVFFASLNTSYAAVPAAINYQGRLLNSSGNPIVSTVTVVFSLWDAESSGNQLGSGWSDSDTVMPSSDGIYTTMIGDEPGNPVPTAVFTTPAVWLNVSVNGENLLPRKRLVAVPYAVHSGSADTAKTAQIAASAYTAQTATQLLGGNLSSPGDTITLGNNVWLEVSEDGHIEIRTASQHYRLGTRLWHTIENLINDRISVGGESAYNPQVAMDNSGNAIIVWLQWDGDTYSQQIYKAEYRNGQWRYPQNLINDRISFGGYHCYSPQVAMDNSGNAIITWGQYDGIYKAEYRNSQWIYPQNLIDDRIRVGDQDANRPNVAMDNNGNAIITWVQYDGTGYHVYKAEYRNGQWIYPQHLINDRINVVGTNASSPQVAMDNSGNAIITWVQYDGDTPDVAGQIYKAEYRNSQWNYPQNLINHRISIGGTSASSPQVAMDNSGNAIITWVQSDGSKRQVYKAEYRNSQWNYPQNLINDRISIGGEDVLFDLQVAMDNNGNAIIIWTQWVENKDQIYKAEYRNSQWSYPQNLINDRISFAGTSASSLQVAMDNNGNAIITWYQSDGDTPDRNQIYKAEYRNSQWNYPQNQINDHLNIGGKDGASDPQVAMDSSGNAIISWMQWDGDTPNTLQIYKAEYQFGF